MPSPALERMNVKRMVRTMLGRESWREFKKREKLRFELPET
jgi:hypothetical protein